jgi:rare lipoprotein A
LRPKLNTPKARLAYAGAGICALAIPATAVGIGGAQPTGAQTVAAQTSAAQAAGAIAAPWLAIGASLSRRRLNHGDRPGLVRAGTASGGQAVQVAAALRVPRDRVNALAGQPVQLRGRLLPGVPGREVHLQARAGAGWRTVAAARTSTGGRFSLRLVAAGLGRRQLRVRFAGDRMNARASALAGQLTVYRESVASWYDDGGSTACGFHAYLGVANRDLPCGTAVTFYDAGRTVTAIVDDRGPFVGGREWDLNQNTAAALGFAGVGTVWSSS